MLGLHTLVPLRPLREQSGQDWSRLTRGRWRHRSMSGPQPSSPSLGVRHRVSYRTSSNATAMARSNVMACYEPDRATHQQEPLTFVRSGVGCALVLRSHVVLLAAESWF
jgi:hypothetical protein